MSSYFSISNNHENNAYKIFRGINNADVEYDWQKTDDTSIIDLAQQKADKTENKSAITIALEDFTNIVTGFNGANYTNIDKNDTKTSLMEFFANLFGKKTDNMFKSKTGKEIVDEYGHISQKDIFQNDFAKNDGIRYANEGDDLYASALNFAKADIAAIEKGYELANDGFSKDGKLQGKEVNSYLDMGIEAFDAIKELDLGDGDDKITAEEYASFLLAVDKMGNSDGVISTQEAAMAKNTDNEMLTKMAKEIYEQYNG